MLKNICCRLTVVKNIAIPQAIRQTPWPNTSSRNHSPCLAEELVSTSSPASSLPLVFCTYLSSTDGESYFFVKKYPLPVHLWLSNAAFFNQVSQDKLHLVLYSFLHVVMFHISWAQVTWTMNDATGAIWPGKQYRYCKSLICTCYTLHLHLLLSQLHHSSDTRRLSSLSLTCKLLSAVETPTSSFACRHGF